MEFLDQWFWFILFVPLAALVGWVIGRRGGQRHNVTQVSHLSSTYFRGLNYLLNEQNDKAIELFLHVADLMTAPLARGIHQPAPQRVEARQPCQERGKRGQTDAIGQWRHQTTA